MSEQGVLYGVKLYANQFDLSGNLTAAAFRCGIEPQDSTRYSTALTGTTSHTKDPGLAFARLEASSLWEAGSAKIDTVAASFQRVKDVLFTLCPLTGTAGEVAYFLRGMETDYRAGEPVGAMAKADLSAECSSYWLRGNVLYNGSVSVTGNGSAFQLGAIASGKYLYGWVHVLSGSGSVVAKIQSDDNSGFTSGTDQMTFTTITGVTSEFLTPVAGAITDDYWRAKFTVNSGGPISVVMGMAIL